MINKIQKDITVHIFCFAVFHLFREHPDFFCRLTAASVYQCCRPAPNIRATGGALELAAAEHCGWRAAEADFLAKQAIPERGVYGKMDCKSRNLNLTELGLALQYDYKTLIKCDSIIIFSVLQENSSSPDT